MPQFFSDSDNLSIFAFVGARSKKSSLSTFILSTPFGVLRQNIDGSARTFFQPHYWSQLSLQHANWAPTLGFPCMAHLITQILPGALNNPTARGGCCITILNRGSPGDLINAPGTSQLSMHCLFATAPARSTCLPACDGMCVAVRVSSKSSPFLIRSPRMAHLTLHLSSPPYRLVFAFKSIR